MVVPAGSLGTVEGRSLAPLSLGVETGFGEVVGVFITEGVGSTLLVVVTVAAVVVVMLEGLVGAEGRVTVITEISPRPWRAGGQDDLTGLTVTDMFGFKDLLSGVLVVLGELTVVMEMPGICDRPGRVTGLG